jgi:hypothetical protein
MLTCNTIPRNVSLSTNTFTQQRGATMDDVKRVGREVETEAKKGMRELDGHDLGDDIGNAGDEVKKDIGNLGDDLRRGGREVGRELDRELHEEEREIR